MTTMYSDLAIQETNSVSTNRLAYVELALLTWDEDGRREVVCIGHGESTRNPEDADDRALGYSIAFSRALTNLAYRFDRQVSGALEHQNDLVEDAKIRSRAKARNDLLDTEAVNIAASHARSEELEEFIAASGAPARVWLEKNPELHPSVVTVGTTMEDADVLTEEEDDIPSRAARRLAEMSADEGDDGSFGPTYAQDAGLMGK